MNWLDILIIVVLGIGSLMGFRRGLILQLFGLVSFIASFLIGFSYMEGVGDWFENQLGVSATYSSLVGFGAVFLGVHVCAMIVSRFLDKVVKKTVVIGGLNRIFGGAVGLITSGLAFSLLLYALATVNLPPSELRSSSALYEVVYQFFPQTWDLATQKFPELTELIDRFPSVF
ncbi:MAG: CvpA family protein [Bacteroidetes bacterium]|nr:CvpA family protein [Bacteroidota bacterium]